MGIFSFFSKDKKETLDKGLSKTKESVFSKITKAIAGKRVRWTTMCWIIWRKY